MQEEVKCPIMPRSVLLKEPVRSDEDHTIITVVAGSPLTDREASERIEKCLRGATLNHPDFHGSRSRAFKNRQLRFLRSGRLITQRWMQARAT